MRQTDLASTFTTGNVCAAEYSDQRAAAASTDVRKGVLCSSINDGSTITEIWVIPAVAL